MKTCQAKSGFTLFELLTVLALVSVLAWLLAGGADFGGGRAVALQSAQATVANLITVARTKAATSGQPVRLLLQIDPASTVQPVRYLRYLVLQIQNGTGWQALAEDYLPPGVYVVPPAFAANVSGLFAEGVSRWLKSDGSALRSNAFHSDQVTSEAITGGGVEQWVSLNFSPYGNIGLAGQIVLATGRPRPPGSYATGDAPVMLDNAEAVRGLAISAYGVPALLAGRASF